MSIYFNLKFLLHFKIIIKNDKIDKKYGWHVRLLLPMRRSTLYCSMPHCACCFPLQKHSLFLTRNCSAPPATLPDTANIPLRGCFIPANPGWVKPPITCMLSHATSLFKRLSHMTLRETDPFLPSFLSKLYEISGSRLLFETKNRDIQKGRNASSCLCLRWRTKWSWLTFF